MVESFKKSSSRDTFESLVVTVILAIFGTTFVLQAFKIPTGSMETTLLIGDHLLVNKFAFAYHTSTLGSVLPYRSVRRGDVVVFKYPYAEEQIEPGEHYVKRVIGIPGDRIKIVHRQVFLNGKPLVEPYVRHIYSQETIHSGDDFPPAYPEQLQTITLRWSREMPNFVKGDELVVPPGKLFVMGDNREQSQDGRFWGFVPMELVTGRPLVIYWSFETPREEYMQNSLYDRARQTFELIVYFIPRTRWRRTMGLVR